MVRCPSCGRYMTSELQMTSGGWRTVWRCICGYSLGDESIYYSNKTNSTIQQSSSPYKFEYKYRCSICDYTVEQDDIYCRHCGTKLDWRNV